MLKLKVTSEELTPVMLLSSTYGGSMAWALGAGIGGVVGSALLGFLFCIVLVSAKFGIEPWTNKTKHTQGTAAELGVPAPSVPPPAGISPSDTFKLSRPDTEASMTELDRSITKAAALADDQLTVLALYRFRKERERSLNQDFDADLADEIDVIATKHFSDLISNYCEGRRLAAPEAAAMADGTLTEAVTRLTKRLIEIASCQNARHIADLEKTGNYIRTRHPIADDDPFGS